ncbi:MAG: gamma-glutamyltransferase [Pseudomonadota bacterium]
MTSFAVACGHQVTAEAAADILRDGGTAVDAAIAAAFAAMVAEPVLAGLLGGGFLMVRPGSGKAELLDFFVQTPARHVPPEDLDFRSVLADFGTTTQEFHVGAGTIAVPGVAPGLAEAHARFGRIPMKTLVQPACALARQGVEINEFQARLFRIVETIYTATASAVAQFCEDDALLGFGASYRNPDLADVLEEYAAGGPRFVTEGEIAQALLSVTHNGGHIDAEDLRAYRPTWRQALRVRRAGVDVALNPPPALGGALIGFGLGLLPHQPDPSTLTAGLEATTRARIDSALDKAADAGAARLLAGDLLQRYRTQLRGRAAATRGTTQISIVDGDGMGAAMTLSNGEGAGMIVPGTGIMPNNMMGESDLLPAGFEVWQPDTRLASMMAPLVANWPDGRFAMLGSGGSNRIRSALLQVLINLIDREMPMSDAIEAPRIHVEAGDPAKVDFEDLGGEAMRAAILDEWPEATPWSEQSMFFGGAHGVHFDPGRGFQAAGDPRRSGVSLIA